MRFPKMLAVLTLSLPLLAATASSQSCPYTVVFHGYGSGCSAATIFPPQLLGQFPSPTGGPCDADVFYEVPLAGPNVVLTNRWLVAGFAPVSLPLPGGCTLLASPDVIIDLPALEGILDLGLLLPPDPNLIGQSFYLQGVDRRLFTLTGSTALETTAGLQVSMI